MRYGTRPAEALTRVRPEHAFRGQEGVVNQYVGCHLGEDVAMVFLAYVGHVARHISTPDHLHGRYALPADMYIGGWGHSILFARQLSSLQEISEVYTKGASEWGRVLQGLDLQWQPKCSGREGAHQTWKLSLFLPADDTIDWHDCVWRCSER